MTDSDDLKKLRERALAPETDANQLFEISAQHPEVYAEVAANPNAYPDLLNWLENVGDDQVKAVVQARRNGLSGLEALGQAGRTPASPGAFEPESSPDSGPERSNQTGLSHSAFAPQEEADEIDNAQEDANDSPQPNEEQTPENPVVEPEPLTDIAAGSKESTEGNGLGQESANQFELGTETQLADVDATRLGSLPPSDFTVAASSYDESATRMVPPVMPPEAYSAPGYSPRPRQSIMTTPAPSYSPYPVYPDPAAQSYPQSAPIQQKPKRSWGIIILTVLLVFALIGLAIVGTWIISSKGQSEGQAASGQSESATTRTSTVVETTVTSTENPTPAARPIPADAVYESHGFFTPTKNIACLMNGDSVYCQIGERQWEKGCNDIWAIELNSSGVNQHCDPGNGTDPQVEASYGTTYYNGDYACEVGQYTGVDCWNSKTGRGFTMRQAERTTY